MPNIITLALIPLLPLASFIILGLFGRTLFKNHSGIVGTFSLFVSFLFSTYTAFGYFFDYGKVDGVYRKLVPLQFSWLSFSNGLSIDIGFIVDPISVMMIVVVTLISLMVHIYSLAYMKGEERFPTYYSFLSLFTFSMLGLVLSSNIFQIYIFWELVGVSSFLLIGYYYNKPTAVAASKKAFIVTRFADVGFLIGILVLSFYSGTLDFSTLIERLTSPESNELKTAVSASFLGFSALTWGLVLVFIGGAGKSALFPLHIWLPDAMEGPTPVSALIHAATMVVAGVYLVARLFPVLALSAPEVLNLVTIVGVISALAAALIACTQTDIKRVLAFSTMSQIGFMMFALGVSGYEGEAGIGYTSSMFHLFTHALFKALLFLGAGSVIHYVHSNEMKDMGGLRKQLPVVHITFLTACLAIAGIPPFAGFFSKEGILLAAYKHDPAVYWLALITSGLTAFYMFRLYFRVFWNREVHHHGNHGEGPFAMKLPLVLLGIGAAVAGFIPFGELVSPDGRLLDIPFHWQFSIAPVSLAVIGIISAMVLFKEERGKADRVAHSMRQIYTTIYRKFYVDELYLFVTCKILFQLIGRPAAWFDRNIIDGLVNITGSTTKVISERIKVIQSGKVQHYGLYFLFGIIGLGVLFIYVIKF
jgi:NADH-quinone oxidoreductase subunit L